MLLLFKKKTWLAKAEIWHLQMKDLFYPNDRSFAHV